mmetsp:Transcript_39585/g.72080  ORF Transcript_39585/g.72080 Transcript_39585/m.72080 type:complete len:83 (+) Transcript_39585:2-250(+)
MPPRAEPDAKTLKRAVQPSLKFPAPLQDEPTHIQLCQRALDSLNRLEMPDLPNQARKTKPQPVQAKVTPAILWADQSRRAPS